MADTRDPSQLPKAERDRLVKMRRDAEAAERQADREALEHVLAILKLVGPSRHSDRARALLQKQIEDLAKAQGEVK